MSISRRLDPTPLSPSASSRGRRFPTTTAAIGDVDASVASQDKRSPDVQAEDDQALADAERSGFVVRRTMLHIAHRIHTLRCRERGVPCICVYLRRDVADVTLKMPRGRSLGADAQNAVTDLIREIGCAAYHVGPRRVVSCRMPVRRASELARLLARLTSETAPART